MLQRDQRPKVAIVILRVRGLTRGRRRPKARCILSSGVMGRLPLSWLVSPWLKASPSLLLKASRSVASSPCGCMRRRWPGVRSSRLSPCFFLAFAILSLLSTLYRCDAAAMLSLFAILYCRWYSLTLALFFSL